MNEVQTYLQAILKDEINKIVFSNPTKKDAYRKIVIEKRNQIFQVERLTQTQAFHETLEESALFAYCMQCIDDGFRQINAFSHSFEHALKLSKKGKVFYKKGNFMKKVPISQTHNRKKHYLIEEGTIVPALVDMGVFTKEGKVVHSMYDKFRQINKLIELVDDVIRKLNKEEYHIIDFGCGKSYLTFLVYYYLVEIAQVKVKMIGLDLKKDVIQKCNESAKRYGYDDLRFEVGDIAGYHTNMEVDLVMTLHACDTATDYALYNAMKWNAKAILSVPCCQHELNSQMHSDELAIFTRYGIIQERTAALMTDMIRANLLQTCGYKTQVLEFVDLSHTPKNLLIRAVKSNLTKQHQQKVLNEVKMLMKQFGLKPTLYTLLYGDEVE